MSFEYKAIRRVEFSETDMAGIVHFSNFFRYMETAEHGFYRSMGFSVILRNYDPPLGFPRVHAECDYKKPLRFEDQLEIHLIVSTKRPKVLTYLFRFNKVEGELRTEVARGSLTVVCVAHSSAGGMASVNMPADIFERIQIAPSELLESLSI